MGPRRRRQGWQVGLDEADVWVAVTDGGSGLEGLLRTHFPRVEAVLLDLFHASQPLAKLAQALPPADDGAALEQTRAWTRLVREEGGEVLLAVRAEFDRPARKGPSGVRAEVVGYLRNQVHRMDYPRYEANGWFIGSGAVGSACKTVVGERRKGRGCGGAKRDRMPSVTSVPCTGARAASGPPSGDDPCTLDPNVHQRK